MMKRILAVLTLLALAATGPWTGSVSADPAIHEIVAAYCSGGDVGVIDSDGFLEPPPIGTFGSPTFARPVLASAAVDPETLTVTGKPNAKFEQGTDVFALTSDSLDHPSAACPGSDVLP
jgi:hypothetical protein